MTCDVDAAADPHVVVFEHVIEKAFERGGATRPTGKARV